MTSSSFATGAPVQSKRAEEDAHRLHIVHISAEFAPVAKVCPENCAVSRPQGSTRKQLACRLQFSKSDLRIVSPLLLWISFNSHSPFGVRSPGLNNRWGAWEMLSQGLLVPVLSVGTQWRSFCPSTSSLMRPASKTFSTKPTLTYQRYPLLELLMYHLSYSPSALLKLCQASSTCAGQST